MSILKSQEKQNYFPSDFSSLNGRKTFSSSLLMLEDGDFRLCCGLGETSTMPAKAVPRIVYIQGELIYGGN